MFTAAKIYYTMALCYNTAARSLGYAASESGGGGINHNLRSLLVYTRLEKGQNTEKSDKCNDGFMWQLKKM